MYQRHNAKALIRKWNRESKRLKRKADENWKAEMPCNRLIGISQGLERCAQELSDFLSY